MVLTYFEKNILDSDEKQFSPGNIKKYKKYIAKLVNMSIETDNVKKKKKIVHKIFRSFWKNIWFLELDSNIRFILFSKLHKFSNENNWDVAKVFFTYITDKNYLDGRCCPS